MWRIEPGVQLTNNMHKHRSIYQYVTAEQRESNSICAAILDRNITTNETSIKANSIQSFGRNLFRYLYTSNDRNDRPVFSGQTTNPESSQE